MTEKKKESFCCSDEGGHCVYKINTESGKELMCVSCGRVKAVRDSRETPWEVLY